MSETLNVFQAITAVADEVGAIAKDELNRKQGFSFRGIDTVVNALSPVMRRHHLTVFPSAVERQNRGHGLTASGATMNFIDVTVAYTFTGPDGSQFTTVVAAESFDSGDKATAKAMSVAFRTALLQTFMLPTDDEDPDAQINEASGMDPQEARKQQMINTFNLSLAKAKGNRENLEALNKWAKSTGYPEQAIAQITAALNELETPNE